MSEGGSHGGQGAAAQQREAGDGSYLASDGGRERGWDHGHLGQVGWAMVAGFAGYAFTTGR
jgi:hypothetical protein